MKPRQDLVLPGLLHDLNNIFQTLIDAADLLSEDPRWKPISAAILRSVERGRRVSSSLDEASRGDRAPFETILENAIAFVEDSVLAGRGASIHFECRVDPAIELPGSWAWERVLINLFLNAMRAMPQGGTIQVDARHSGTQAVAIMVRDTGCGILPELLEHLFEPHISTKMVGGLGLHVVRAIVEEEGGTVTAANREDGLGAEFKILVPAPAPRSRPAHA